MNHDDNRIVCPVHVSRSEKREYHKQNMIEMQVTLKELQIIVSRK